MRFEWDPSKSRANFRKHGISFEAACQVFGDPNHISIQDQYEHGEERWQTLGLVGSVAIFLVAHTFSDEDGEEVVRIISARKATPREKRRYHDAI